MELLAKINVISGYRNGFLLSLLENILLYLYGNMRANKIFNVIT